MGAAGGAPPNTDSDGKAVDENDGSEGGNGGGAFESFLKRPRTRPWRPSMQRRSALCDNGFGGPFGFDGWDAYAYDSMPMMSLMSVASRFKAARGEPQEITRDGGASEGKKSRRRMQFFGFWQCGN
jgi:hypothetical protein